MKNKEPKCPACLKKANKWYKEKLFIISIIIAVILSASFFVPVLKPLYKAFVEYTALIWWAILIGILLGGLIDHLVPRAYISKYLSKHEKKTIFHAVMLGFFMSACSHGILAIAIELYKKGASVPAVIAFLLSSPWANLPVTILLFGFFGTKAFFFVGFAIIIALITGFAYQFLDKKGLIEKSKNHIEVDSKFSIVKDIKKRWEKTTVSVKGVKQGTLGILKGSWALTKMVVWWILIGMLLASAAQAYIPHHFFMKYMGATVLGLLVTLGVATVIEICSEGTAPLAFEIFRQTGAFGNSFVFLMAGVATDYTEIGLIWTNIGRKAALWLPIITVPQVLALAYLFNLFL